MWTFILVTLVGACAPDDPQQAFDESENDDTLDEGGKADGRSGGYRSGCGAPIRSGRYALAGDIVTPTGVVAGGYLVVDGEQIAEVRTAAEGAPAGVTVVSTGGYILPGLIDGHSHVEYNHIPLAQFGKRYGDRDQWPNAAAYQTLVKDPKNAVTAAGLTCEALKHGEARALVGGTTAIQGTPQLSCVRPLVRNLEQENFCKDRVRQNVTDASGFGRSISGKPSFADSVKSDIAAHKLDAVVVHLGEGIDAHAESEWSTVKSLGLNLPELVIIHGTAFGPSELSEMASAGAKMIWSPLSNLLLYGNTAKIPAALDAGVLVALGSDWAPSGSANLLWELKTADHVNRVLWNGRITDEELFDMVTINPAIAFGIDKEVGTLEAGKTADYMVIAKSATAATAYRALIEARPENVLLVAISGDPLYGEPAFLDSLGKAGDYELIDACGQRRAIDVTVTASDVPNAGESLSSIESKLAAVNPHLTPLVDCTNDAEIAALTGSVVGM